MNEIRGTGPGFSPLPQTPSAGGETPVAPLGALATVDMAKILAGLASLAATLQTQAPGGTPGITNANGAPEIDGVTLNFSPEDLVAALQVLQGKTQDAQLKTASEGLTTNQKKIAEQNHQAMEKINDWISKCQDAAAKSKASSILGWIMKALTFVAAIVCCVVATVATIASGGAAAPLLAVAAVALVSSGISLASQISEECGGPKLELSALMAKLGTKILEACGVPEDKAAKFGKMMAGMAAMACPLLLCLDPGLAGEAIGGFSELLGADENQVAIISGVFTAVATIAVAAVMVAVTCGTGAGAAVDGVLKCINTGAKIVSVGVGVATGIGSVTQGGLGIAKAYDERDAANIQADKKLIDAVIIKLQQAMEEEREQIKKVMQELQDGISLVSQMINAGAENRSQIASNIGGRGQTV